jgi:hypothetical protein
MVANAQPLCELPSLFFCANCHLVFLRELPKFYNIELFRGHGIANLGDCRKLCMNCMLQWKSNFDFYNVFLQKYMYDGPIYNTVHVSNTDPSPLASRSFCSDLVPWKSFGSLQSTELRAVIKSARSENHAFLHLWIRYSINRSLKMANF